MRLLGSSESTLVKMPHCWKSHVAAQLFFQVETVHSEIIENEVLALIPTADFVQMVYNFKQVMLH